MEIEEVAQLTGLAAETIHLYEAEQLITVNHSNHLHSDYSDETVKYLLEIKLYQKFGIKIADLKRWKNGEVSIQILLSNCL